MIVVTKIMVDNQGKKLGQLERVSHGNKLCSWTRLLERGQMGTDDAGWVGYASPWKLTRKTISPALPKSAVRPK